MWTDDTQSASEQETTRFLADLAASLDAELVGEEDELLTAEPKEPSSGSRLNTVLGGVLALLSLPFVVLLVLVRLPWVLWKLLGRLR